jgi:predicted RND superfamily exporter protein
MWYNGAFVCPDGGMSLLIETLVNRRYLLAALVILAAAAVLAGITRTEVDNTFNAILSESDPYRDEVEEVRKDFPPSTGVLFAFMVEEGGDIFRFDALWAMEDLTNRYVEIESAVSVASLSNRRLNAVDANIHDRDYLLPDLTTLEEDDLGELRDIGLADEDLTKSLLAPGGDLALALVRYKVASDDKETRLSVAESVVALRDSLRAKYPEVGIYVLGNVLFELDSYKAQIKDSQVLAPLVMSISILLLWFCLKSLIFALTIFSVAFLTIGLTVGTAGWLSMPFNQISTMGPLVVLMIATAHGVHIVSIYAQGLHRGMGKLEAMRDSLRVNFQPVTLATVTTAMGFLSLNYCSSPGIYGFGNVVAIGVVWAYVATLALLPGLILLLPIRRVPRPLGVNGFIDLVSRLVAERGTLLFWSSTALILVTLALLPLNKIDFNRFSFVDKDSDFHQVMTALSEKIGNDQSLVYGVHSGKYYGITEPGFLAQVDAFSAWLEAQPEASFVSSYTDYLKIRNEAEHDNDEAWYKLPEDHLQIIDYLVGYQLVQEIEPNLQPLFNPDYSAIRLVVGTSNLSNRELLAFNDRIDAWIASNVAPGYRVLHGDNSILFARLDRSISIELLQGFAVSFLLITLTLLVGLRSLRYGLISIAPNVFPATIVFGFWGVYNGQLSPYILMLFSISIGLVVDDSVHVLSKYIKARRDGDAPEVAVHYSLDKAGPAITITTLSLSVSTVILVFSNTFYYENVALMLTPIIVVAWLLDLLFLPPLLIRFDRWIDGLRGLNKPAPVS